MTAQWNIFAKESVGASSRLAENIVLKENSFILFCFHAQHSLKLQIPFTPSIQR